MPPHAHPIQRTYQGQGVFFSLICISTIMTSLTLHHRYFLCKPVSLQSSFSFSDQCDGRIVRIFHHLQYLFVSCFNDRHWCGSHSHVGGVSGSVEDWGDVWGFLFFSVIHISDWCWCFGFGLLTKGLELFIWDFIIVLVKSFWFFLSFLLFVLVVTPFIFLILWEKTPVNTVCSQEQTERSLTLVEICNYWSITMDYP